MFTFTYITFNDALAQLKKIIIKIQDPACTSHNFYEKM